MGIKKCYILLMLMSLGVQLAQSQEQTLTESFEHKIYFREGYRYVEPSYRENRVSLDKLRSILSESQSNGTLLSVDIQAWASPKGGEKHNEVLAQNRTRELVRWIVNNCPVSEEKIKQISGGVGWDILCDLLSASDRIYKEKVIDIIRNTPIFVTDNQGKIITGRKKKLMDHNYGRSWKDMESRFFPDIRCGLSVVVYVKKQDPVVPVPEEKTEAVEQPIVEPETPDTTAVQPAFQPEEDRSGKYMAVKTNLLEDALLVPNIGVEFYLGNQWSIGGNWMYAWWSNDRKHDYWRIYGGDINIRKYFGSKAKEKPLQGHHIGVYAQIVTYDFERGGKGYMGGVPGGTLFDKFNYGGGIEYGYSMPIARRLNLDFSIGIGYLGGEYHEYLPGDDCYVWQATKNRRYWGPTKAEVSLVWLIGKNNFNPKKGGKR